MYVCTYVRMYLYIHNIVYITCMYMQDTSLMYVCMYLYLHTRDRSLIHISEFLPTNAYC